MHSDCWPHRKETSYIGPPRRLLAAQEGSQLHWASTHRKEASYTGPPLRLLATQEVSQLHWASTQTAGHTGRKPATLGLHSDCWPHRKEASYTGPPLRLLATQEGSQLHWDSTQTAGHTWRKPATLGPPLRLLTTQEGNQLHWGLHSDCWTHRKEASYTETFIQIATLTADQNLKHLGCEVFM